MSRFDETKKLIEVSSDIAEFGDFGHGVSEEWIERAEHAIGFRFPDSYRWWLRNYGGGEIGGEEIFSIYCEDFDTVVGGDIVQMYRLQGDNGNKLPICHSDVDGVFFFDCSIEGDAGEYPVVSAATGKVYAKDFLEFMQKRITAFKSV